MPKPASHNRKRRKAKKENPYPDLQLDRSYLVEAPIEVLSNILQYVHPVDLLSLTRTNSYLRKTLLHPQQQHIWKTARIFFPHAKIPDPVQISEMIAASLLFDRTNCSICKGPAYGHLRSHVQPVRVCDREECRKTFEELYVEPPSQWSTLICGIIPSVKFMRSEPLGFFHTPPLFYSTRSTRCRRKDILPILQDIEAGLRENELQIKYNTTAEETKSFNCFIETLELISKQLYNTKHRLDSRIQEFVKTKLVDFNQKDIHLTDSLTYCDERRRLLRHYQEFTEADWDACLPRGATCNPFKPNETVGQRIIKEIQTTYEASQRRQTEATIQNTRKAVMTHWGQMKNEAGTASLGGTVVPRWNEFQTLPVVNTLLKPKANASDLGDLKQKDSTLAKMVRENVDSWDKRTRAQFRKILKVPIPKKNQVLEAGTIPPLDRVTSLFECTKCKSVGLGLAQEGALTFYSAVKHRCPGASINFQWNADIFQPDEHATQIARYAVNLSGHDETKTTRVDMDALGQRFLCKLCARPIYLRYGNLIGHLKRHGIKELQESLQYFTEPPELDSTIPSSVGMVEKRRRGCKKGFCSDPGSKDFFVCRHCEKTFVWNALVSHVKAKHNFPDIRDEDFYPKPKLKLAADVDP